MENTKNNTKTQNKKILFGIAGLVALIVVLAAVYVMFRPKPVEGSKNITIEVVDKEGGAEKFEFRTDAEYLRQAMEEAEGLTFSGTESEYGMMVDTVNGTTADYSVDQSYWAFYVNGEYCNYGIETQPVADGDQFSIVYTAE